MVGFFIAFIVFYKETKHVIVGNSVFNEILMQTFAKYFFCSSVANCILYEDRCARKTKYLSVCKELNNLSMAISEMTSVTLIEYHYNARVAYFIDATAIPLLTYSCIELLHGGDNDLRVALKASNQLVGVVCSVYSSRLKSLILCLSLRVEVVPVHNKHHLIYIV